jgi:hypothetical protein
VSQKAQATLQACRGPFSTSLFSSTFFNDGGVSKQDDTIILAFHLKCNSADLFAFIDVVAPKQPDPNKHLRFIQFYGNNCVEIIDGHQ